MNSLTDGSNQATVSALVGPGVVSEEGSLPSVPRGNSMLKRKVPQVEKRDVREWSEHCTPAEQTTIYRIEAHFGNPFKKLPSWIRTAKKEVLITMLKNKGRSGADLIGKKNKLLETLKENPFIVFEIDGRECFQRVLAVFLHFMKWDDGHLFSMTMPRRGECRIGCRKLLYTDAYMDMFFFYGQGRQRFATSESLETYMKRHVEHDSDFDEDTALKIIDGTVPRKELESMLGPLRSIAGSASETGYLPEQNSQKKARKVSPNISQNSSNSSSGTTATTATKSAPQGNDGDIDDDSNDDDDGSDSSSDSDDESDDFDFLGSAAGSLSKGSALSISEAALLPDDIIKVNYDFGANLNFTFQVMAKRDNQPLIPELKYLGFKTRAKVLSFGGGCKLRQYREGSIPQDEFLKRWPREGQVETSDPSTCSEDGESELDDFDGGDDDDDGENEGENEGEDENNADHDDQA